MSFYIKLLGNWTKQLHSAFQARIASDGTQPLGVFVRGPFGAPKQHVDKYSRIFLISGGIGATPLLSICKQPHHLHEEHDKQVHSHHLPKNDEGVVDDEKEIRIRKAVKNIYDVDMDVLDQGSRVENRNDESRESNARVRMDHVAEMLRATRNNSNCLVGVSNAGFSAAAKDVEENVEPFESKQSVSQRQSIDTTVSTDTEDRRKSINRTIKGALKNVAIAIGSSTPGKVSPKEKRF